MQTGEAKMAKPVVNCPTQRTGGYSVVGERIHVLAHGDETGAGEAFIQEGSVGSGPPPHTHPWDEAYLMLEGEMDVLLGSETVHLKPGMFVYIPANTPHNFRYTTPGRFFSYTSAPGAARFFREMDRDAPEVPPNIPRIVEIATRNQVRLAGPPPG
jgi:mannose-6-phosphate isomerase-like protein (cupin superfamily)